MSHPFGDLLSQHLHRKHGLSQAKLAEGILQDPSIIGKMCKGQRLTGRQARERVVASISWLHQQRALTTVGEANQLLAAAGMADLCQGDPTEKMLLRQLDTKATPPQVPSFPASATPASHHTNLPALLTSFVGRAQELNEVAQLVANNRLVTLTGAGGVGKTRLALETAKAILDLGVEIADLSKPANPKFPDGVWFIELAALEEGALSTALIAEAIGRLFKTPVQANHMTLEGVLEVIADKALLLVLDNCEHLVATCADICEHLLHHCWHLHILATSREDLRIPGEVVYAVLPLALPSPTESSPKAVLASAATQLFVDRLHATLPTSKIADSEIATVARICRQLDGIPLALELAAPLARSLPLADIAARLDNQMALLTNSYRTAIPRHQTMHSALIWSYQLLGRDEQQLLARTSVFVGGWTMEAAQAVCTDAAAVQSGAVDVAALLQQLSAKSLLLVETVNGDRRHRLLEPIRQFAYTQLIANGERELIERRHALYFLALAEQMEAARDTPQERAWLKKLEPERNNLRAVNRWAFAHNEAEFAQRFNGFLFAFWIYCSSMLESSHWLEGALALTQARNQNGRTISALTAKAQALNTFGYVVALGGNLVGAQTLFEQELALRQEIGGGRGIAAALRGLGFALLLANNLEKSQQYGKQALAISRAVQDKWGIAWSIYNVGYLAMVRGEMSTAQVQLEGALLICREQGITWAIFRVLFALGHVMHAMNKHEQARQFYVDALHLQQEMHYLQVTADVLEGLAAIAAAEDHASPAVRILGAAQAQRQAINFVRWIHYETNYERTVALTHRQLDTTEWDAAWDEGCAMNLEQAVEYALEHL